MKYPTPELYLSLLSGRYYGDVSHTSTEPPHNGLASRTVSIHPFPNDPKGIRDLLDAFASICVRQDREIFFVSLAMGPNSATLYIASNDTVPLTICTYLHKIRGQLQKINAVLEFDVPIPNDSESWPNPKDTQPRTDLELELKKTVYEHTYSKLRQRFFKRAPAILAKYSSIKAILQFTTVAPQDIELLANTIDILKGLGKLLGDEQPPRGQDLIDIIETIDSLSTEWHRRWNAGGDGDILTQWDNIVRISDPSQIRMLSLRRLLEKLFVLRNHIRTINRVAWSRRLSPILKGDFKVVPVPADHGRISLKFSEQAVLPIIFPPERPAKMEVKKTVYDELLQRLEKRAKQEEVVLKKRPPATELSSMDVKVHAECTLLAYHLRHPETDPYPYFGGSKLSCHGCGIFFDSFNLVAESFRLSQFFTKGHRDKIYLRWPCPFLLSQEQRIRLHDTEPSLDTCIRKGMVEILSAELDTYVNELRAAAEAPSESPSLSDSTDAFGSSHPEESGTHSVEAIRARLLARLSSLENN